MCVCMWIVSSIYKRKEDKIANIYVTDGMWNVQQASVICQNDVHPRQVSRTS